MSFYKYVKRYFDIGGSAQEFALEQPGLPVSPTAYGPRYNIRRDFAPLTGALPYAPKMGPEVDLKANGIYFSGNVQLQALSEFMGAKK